MKYSKQLRIFAAAAFALTTYAASAFLYENGTFDAPLDLGDGLGWDAFGNWVTHEDGANGAPGDEFGSYSQNGDGEFGLAFQTGNSTNGGFSQDIRVEAGRVYSFSIQSNHGQDYYNQIIVASNGTEEILVLVEVVTICSRFPSHKLTSASTSSSVASRKSEALNQAGRDGV